MQPQTSELDALRDSALLLKFAVENIKDEKDLPQATVSTITTAWKQREEDKWDPDISTQFWVAYAKLCTLIKPVTLDTLTTTRQERSVKRWTGFGSETQVSLANRSARRYLIVMLTLLGLSLPFSFVASMANTLMSESHDNRLYSAGASRRNGIMRVCDPLNFGRDKGYDVCVIRANSTPCASGIGCGDRRRNWI
jgi:hypothetical protein